MKARRILIKMSFPMVGMTCWSSEAALQRGPTFKFKWRNLIQIWLLCAVLLQALTSGAQPVTQIAAGGGHSLFLKSDGSLWAMGDNSDGQLGDGISARTNRPEQIVASDVTAIAAGHEHSLFLKNDGSLWAMGRYWDSLWSYDSRPKQIVASNVTVIAAGDLHNLILKCDGSLWAIGDNSFGQLGDGRQDGTNQPEQIVASNVTAIAAGGSHSLLLKNDGSLWAMGQNWYGQLGDGTYTSTNRPKQIVASNVTAIAAGLFHSLFLKSDGSLWVMGANTDHSINIRGQLGDGTYNFDSNQPEQIVASNVTAIAGGMYHSLFLKGDGSLWGMGFNEYGQLGDGIYSIFTNRPEQVVAGGVTAIAAGDNHSLFLKNDGSLWAMGFNRDGELGDGTYNIGTNRPEQIVVNPSFNKIAGQIWGGTNMQLTFFGYATTNYALDRSSSLSPPNWIPQATNAAGSFGALVFTNPPEAATNNFWRIRSVP
jgi:alpha-tubulin suppressor-like RCC1 family protein